MTVWIPAFAGMTEGEARNDMFLLVTPAQAGVHCEMWISAFAEMTGRGARNDRRRFLSETFSVAK